MTVRETIIRYILIIQKLRRFGASFEEIDEYLLRESEIRSYDLSISKRTFQRDLNDIRAIFNIDIKYDKSRRMYYRNYDEQTDINERIMEAFDTFNALNLSDHLSDFIHFETRKPQGTENLNGLLHAIKNKRQIKFLYHKFWDVKPEERYVEPHAIKEFKNRWYVLVLDLKDKKIKSFGLDRLSELQICQQGFEHDLSFNVKEHFKDCFGIISPNNMEPEEVILSFDSWQGNYIKSLPLHSSQKVIVDNKDEIRISLNIIIAYDFIIELLSLGERVKVISPTSLIDELRKIYNTAMEQY